MRKTFEENKEKVFKMAAGEQRPFLAMKQSVGVTGGGGNHQSRTNCKVNFGFPEEQEGLDETASGRK